MGDGNVTLFTNDNGGTASATDYIQDVFEDVSLSANSNSGLTDTASTNPLGVLFGNDDGVKFSAKTLWIKDIVRIENKSKWINNKPTYKIIWSEEWPGAVGYVFGDFFLSSQSDVGNRRVDFKSAGDGIGVSGKIRRVAFICEQKQLAASTGQFVVDGVNGGTVDLGTAGVSTQYPVSNGSVRQNYYAPRIHSATNETNDLHDIRITAVQNATAGQSAIATSQFCALSVTGVIVYYENASANVEVSPGTTYVDKSKNTTVVGGTFSIPSFGSSLGGMASVVKSQTSGYTLISRSFSAPVSVATGLSGTNLLTVGTGHGASYPVGSGVVLNQGGGSFYVGSVQSVSTDTLTVFPTLSFGVSNACYRAWLSGPTLSVNASLMVPFKTIDFTGPYGFTKMMADPECRYYTWGNPPLLTRTNLNGLNAMGFGASNGFYAIEGRFTAADVEFVANGGILHATMSVNGCPVWGTNSAQGNAVKRTLFSEGPYQWNQLLISAGASNAASIGKITLYEPASVSATFGVLGTFNSMPGLANRSAVNATLAVFSTYQRVFANQFVKSGPWTTTQSASFAGGYVTSGSTTTCYTSLSYYGKNFAIQGVPGGGTLSVDGVGVGLSFGFMHTVASEGWHTVQYTAGTTALVSAIDFTRSYGEVKNRQNTIKETEVLLPSLDGDPNKFELFLNGTGIQYGSIGTKIRCFPDVRIINGSAATYASESTNGDTITVNKEGVYSIFYQDAFDTAAYFGISINTNATSTNIQSLDFTTEVLSLNYATTAGVPAIATATVRLFPGDTIRPHTGGIAIAAGGFSQFRMTRVGD